jgi:transcriptional regulator with XRE-family HTH domain
VSAVGDRIRSRRRELGLSQREIAEPGVSYAYISRIEGGARDPSVKALRKIAGKLGVSAHWLETGEEEPLEKYVRELGRLSEIERALDRALADLDGIRHGHVLTTESAEALDGIIGRLRNATGAPSDLSARLLADATNERRR